MGLPAYRGDLLLMLLAQEASAFCGDVACGIDIPVEGEAAVGAMLDPLAQRELCSRLAR